MLVLKGGLGNQIFQLINQIENHYFVSTGVLDKFLIPRAPDSLELIRLDRSRIVNRSLNLRFIQFLSVLRLFVKTDTINPVVSMWSFGYFQYVDDRKIAQFKEQYLVDIPVVKGMGVHLRFGDRFKQDYIKKYCEKIQGLVTRLGIEEIWILGELNDEKRVYLTGELEIKVNFCAQNAVEDWKFINGLSHFYVFNSTFSISARLLSNGETYYDKELKNVCNHLIHPTWHEIS